MRKPAVHIVCQEIRSCRRFGRYAVELEGSDFGPVVIDGSVVELESSDSEREVTGRLQVELDEPGWRLKSMMAI